MGFASSVATTATYLPQAFHGVASRINPLATAAPVTCTICSVAYCNTLVRSTANIHNAAGSSAAWSSTQTQRRFPMRIGSAGWPFPARVATYAYRAISTVSAASLTRVLSVYAAACRISVAALLLLCIYFNAIWSYSACHATLPLLTTCIHPHCTR